MFKLIHLFFLFAVNKSIFGQVDFFRGPPAVETSVNLLDSYIPAAMQIIAYLTETMKYEIRPPGTGGSATATPTSTHKPGIYAPASPLGPQLFLQKNFDYREYFRKIGTDLPSFLNKYYLNPESQRVQIENNENTESSLKKVIGGAPSFIIKLMSMIDDNFSINDVDNQIQDFSQLYDDSDFRFYLTKAKRVPPTRAYVTLLSLYDLLNKEAKKLGFNQYHGYAQNILVALSETSLGTSSEQLKTVLDMVVKRKDTSNVEILKKINTLLGDLDQDSSYLNAALRYIPPLQFLL